MSGVLLAALSCTGRSLVFRLARTCVTLAALPPLLQEQAAAALLQVGYTWCCLPHTVQCITMLLLNPCRSKLQLRGWKMVVTGHSLGAAVATLLGMQLRERFAGEPRRSPDCSACVLGLWPRCRACSCGSGLRVSRCHTLHTRFRAALLGLQPAGAASRTYRLLASAYVVG